MAKKKFTVEITETLQRQIEVKANNEDEAEQIARDMYRREEIVLTSEDYIDTEFEVLSSQGKTSFTNGEDKGQDTPFKEIKIKTKNGVISASEAGSDYPGIWLEYIDDKDDDESLSRPQALMEADPETGRVRLLIWTDPNNEDYTREILF